MRMTIEGPLELREWNSLVRLIREMDRGRTDRVISVFFEDGDDLFPNPDDFIAWANSMGLPHIAVVPVAEGEVSFESGGGVRIVPIQPGETEL